MLTTRSSCVAAAVLTALLGGYGPARAQAEADPGAEAKPWRVVLGLGVQHRPDYMGSRDTRTRVVPIATASIKTDMGRFSLGDVPAAPRAFFAYTPYETENATLGIGVGRDAGRNDDGATAFQMGSSKLRGMGDVDATAIIGVYGSYRIDRVRVGGLVQGAVDRDKGHGGRVASFYASYALPLPERWSGDLTLGANWADSRYMRSFFGVTPGQSAASGFAAYGAGSGLLDVAASLAVRYHVDAHTAVLMRAGVARLGSEARDSPLVSRATQSTLFAGVSYRF